MGRTKKMMQDLEADARNEKVENQEGTSGMISRTKLNENWKEYLTNHPFNHRAACVKGEIFDKINSYQGKLYCFPLRFGSNVDDGDVIMLNQYCEAYAIDDRCTVPYEEWIMSEIVGIAYLVVYMSNGHGLVFVKEVGVFEFANSSDPELAVTPDDVCSACYLEDSETVCNDPMQAFAGQVMSVEGDVVKVFVSLEINDHKKWVWDQEMFPDDLCENMRARW